MHQDGLAICQHDEVIDGECVKSRVVRREGDLEIRQKRRERAALAVPRLVRAGGRLGLVRSGDGVDEGNRVEGRVAEGGNEASVLRIVIWCYHVQRGAVSAVYDGVGVGPGSGESHGIRARTRELELNLRFGAPEHVTTAVTTTVTAGHGGVVTAGRACTQCRDTA